MTTGTAPTGDWQRCHDAIYTAIMEKGWNADRQAFTQQFGGTAPDASVLTMPLVRFISPGDDCLLRPLDEV